MEEYRLSAVAAGHESDVGVVLSVLAEAVLSSSPGRVLVIGARCGPLWNRSPCLRVKG